MSLARARGLWVLEDAACALGATVNGKHVGTFGDIGCFSFHPRKSITTGEGGMAVTSDDATDATLRSLRDHGSASNPSGGLMPDFPILGFNYRMTDIQGAIGSVQMDRASELVNERRRIASKYDTGLAGLDWIQLPTVPADYEHGFQSYVIAVTGEGRSFDEVSSNQVTRDRFVDTLGGAGIGCRPGTHAPPLTSYYRRRYGYEARDYPNASYAEASTAALPVYPGLLDEEIDYVIDVVRSFEPVGQV
jgi:dTDP-4-amino-4,6-dideoxygalactose transaminase